MMKMSSLTISICPRWKSPWWRMLSPSMSGGSSAPRRSRKARAVRQQLIDQRAIGFLDRVASLAAAHRRRARRGRRHPRSSAATSLGAGSAPARSRHQLLLLAEREMHLGDAPSGLRHVAQIRHLLFALAGMLARRQQALLLDKAVEIGRCHGPGIALILDEGVDDRRSRCVLSPSTSSTLPSSAGVLAKPATSVRKRPTSISGLMPGSSLR